MHDVAALAGVPVGTVKAWTQRQRRTCSTPIPPFDNKGAAVWLRSTIVAWLLAEGLATPDDVYGGR